MDTSFLKDFKDRYADLEDYRQRVAMKVNRWYFLIILLTVGSTGGIIYYGLEADNPLIMLSLAPPVACPIFMFHAYSKTAKKYRSRFKSEVIFPLIKQVSCNLQYRPDEGVKGKEFRESGLYPEAISCTTSEDLIYGKHMGIEFRFSEMLVQHESYNYSQNRASKKSKTVFNGIFMVADTLQTYNGRHIIIKKSENRGILSQIGDYWEMTEKKFGEAYLIGDENFDNSYKFYSNNREEAIQLISPMLKAKLMYFATIADRDFRLSFAGSNLYIAIQMDGNLFEPALFKPITGNKILEEHFANIKHITEIIEILAT